MASVPRVTVPTGKQSGVCVTRTVSCTAAAAHFGNARPDASRHPPPRARGVLTITHAKIPAKKPTTYSPNRMRASDEFVDSGEDYDYDEYVHMGRPNKTALKRLMTEYANLTEALCELPKSSIAKITMPETIRDEIYAVLKINSNIARKRALGRVTKLIRGLDDDEALPIQTAVENLKNGIGLLTVEPEVEETATMWREGLLDLDPDDDSVQKDTQEQVFGLLQHRDDWTFTRQELGQLVVTARREKTDAKVLRDQAAAEKEKQDAEAIVMPDGTTVPRALGAVTPVVTGKRKKAVGKTGKKLLKHLRTIAEVAHADGLV